MQPNVITLPVDVLNNATAVDYDFTRYEEFQNRSKYIGENHTAVSKDTLDLYRTQPKQSGNFRGVGKSALKFSKDISVDGVDSTTALTAAIIVEVSFSAPVGATTAQLVEMRQRAIALLDDDSIMDDLNSLLMV